MVNAADLTLRALKDVAQYGVPSRGAASLFDVGTGPYLDSFEREVFDELVSQGGATFRVFEGPYRAGKTHLLNLLRERAVDRGMVVVYADLSAALALDDWKSVVKFLLENLSWTSPDGTEATSVGDILEALAETDTIDVERLAAARLTHAGFHSAMLLLASGAPLRGEARQLLHEYLRGQRIGAGVLRKADPQTNGVKDPLSQRNAGHALRTVLHGLHLLGVPGTLVLLDETENIFQSRRRDPTRSDMRAGQLLRTLIDGCITGGFSGTVFAFAVFPDFITSCGRVNPAVMQRLSVARRTELAPSWRWPVLPIEDACVIRTPEEFLEGAIEVYTNAARRIGTPPTDLERRLRREGDRVLRDNAGSGYRGPLVKALANCVLQTTRR